MRRLATLLVPVLALSACYPGYRSGPDSYRYSHDRWYDAADVPLAARIDQIGSGLGIRLNRPAYVAMFEIIPGQGVGLYYPAYSAEEAYFPTGFTSLPLHGTRRYDSYFTGLPARYSRGEPRFYFLVASRRPLRSIARFQRADGSIRSVLGLTAYNTMNYRQVMDDLVQAVVPLQDDADWTTDVLAIWPRDYGYYSYGERYTRVYCGDGTVEVVPWELARYACQRQRRPVVVREPRTADNNNPPPAGGVDSVRAPGRHRPQPAGGETEAAETGRVGVPHRRPGTPEAAEPATPRVRGGDGETSAVPGEGGDDARAPRVEPRERPRAESPRPEPRESPRSEPRSETPRPTPRSESPRTEPRAESPRPQPVRNDPPPRSEPTRSSEPSRSSEPRSEPASRPEPRPAAPPAQG